MSDRSNQTGIQPAETGIAPASVGYKSPPAHTRFGVGNQAAKGHGRPVSEPAPAIEPMPTAQDLATPHVARAIQVLAELLDHDNPYVRRGAACDLIGIANPDLNDAKVEKLVDQKLQQLFEEAQAARAAEQARGIEVKPP